MALIYQSNKTSSFLKNIFILWRFIVQSLVKIQNKYLKRTTKNIQIMKSVPHEDSFNNLIESLEILLNTEQNYSLFYFRFL